MSARTLLMRLRVRPNRPRKTLTGPTSSNFCDATSADDSKRQRGSWCRTFLSLLRRNHGMSRRRGEQSVRGKCCVSRGTAPRLARLGRTAGTPTIQRDVCLGTSVRGQPRMRHPPALDAAFRGRKPHAPEHRQARGRAENSGPRCALCTAQCRGVYRDETFRQHDERCSACRRREGLAAWSYLSRTRPLSSRSSSGLGCRRWVYVSAVRRGWHKRKTSVKAAKCRWDSAGRTTTGAPPAAWSCQCP